MNISWLLEVGAGIVGAFAREQMPRAVVTWLAVAFAGFALAACGVKGSLDTPQSSDNTARAESAQGKPAGATDKPHKDNPLDALIR